MPINPFNPDGSVDEASLEKFVNDQHQRMLDEWEADAINQITNTNPQPHEKKNSDPSD